MTMTRETKVGVVVCLSFLGLVGVVLAMKLRGDALPEDEQALKDEIIDDPPLVGSEGKGPSVAVRIPIQANPDAGPPVIQVGAVRDAQPLPPPPNNSAPNEPPAPDLGALPQGVKEEVAPSVAGIPGPAGPNPHRPDELIDGTPVLTTFGLLVLPIPPSALADAPAANSMGNDIHGPDDVPPPETTTAGVKEATVPVAPPGVAIVQEHNPNAATLAEEVPPPDGQKGNVTNGQRQSEIAGDKATPTKQGDITLSVAPPPPAADAPRANLPAPKQQPQTSGSSELPNQSVQGAPVQPILPVSANDNPRRIGAAPTAVTPPIRVPSPGVGQQAPSAPAAPQVESYDEESYRIKAGDTFGKISSSHYNTDKYADALERWNINHPQADDNLRANPPRLDAGHLVYIPPAYMLEKRHGNLIPGYKPRLSPNPLDTPRTANAAPRADAASNAASSFKWYQVGPRGETMREIARATLADPERWKDISKLNPAINPAYAIRAELLIKVPLDAKTPAANGPQPSGR